jgi:hypothetical protein
MVAFAGVEPERAKNVSLRSAQGVHDRERRQVSSLLHDCYIYGGTRRSDGQTFAAD